MKSKKKRDPKSKTFKYTDETALAEIRKGLSDVIRGADVVSDLSTADVFFTGTTYRDHLTDYVGTLDLSAFGVEDKGEKGYEDDMENDLLREQVIGRLINPKTPSDLKFAEEEITNYFEQAAFLQYQTKRQEIEGAETPVVVPLGGITGKNRKVQYTDRKGTKAEIWSNDIVNLRTQLAGMTKVKSGTKIAFIGTGMYTYVKDKGYARARKRNDGKIVFSRDPETKIPIGGYFQTINDVFTDQGIPLGYGATGEGGGTSKTAIDYINEQ